MISAINNYSYSGITENAEKIRQALDNIRDYGMMNGILIMIDFIESQTEDDTLSLKDRESIKNLNTFISTEEEKGYRLPGMEMVDYEKVGSSNVNLVDGFISKTVLRENFDTLKKRTPYETFLASVMYLREIGYMEDPRTNPAVNPETTRILEEMQNALAFFKTEVKNLREEIANIRGQLGSADINPEKSKNKR